MKKEMLIYGIMIGFVVILLTAGLVFFNNENEYKVNISSENKTIYLDLNKEIILMFVGDVMLSRGIDWKIRKTGDYKWPFLKIAEYVKGADLLFGNLEGPISDKGRNVGSIYSFRANPKVVEALRYAGFDLLSVANNHIGDWSRVAMEDTFKILKENNIDYVGGGFSEQEAHNPIIKEIKGIKFAFLGYSGLGAKWTETKEDNSGIAWIEEDRIRQDIKRAKSLSDIIIVSFHFGEEYQNKSNIYQQNIARSAIDNGANLVIGHHPHVAQEIEKYNNGYIVYSLGNFIFDQLFSEETRNGMLLKVIVKNKEIKELDPIDIRISDDFQVELVAY